MANFVRIPKRGDIAANELAADVLGNHRTVYIPREQYKAEDIAGTHEVLGSVAGIIGNDALIVNPDCGTSAKWTDRLWWNCSGYTLDGASHTITFSLHFASNSWNSTDKTITYSATTLSGLISALNTAFAADSDFTEQEWYADEYDGKLRLTCEDLDYSQTYNSSSGGLTIGGCMPGIDAFSDMRRKNGFVGDWGAISSMQRALYFYRNDNGADSYLGGRTSEQTSVKQQFPINLPTWLGTSTKNPGDFCAPLRAIYGEGEDGWRRYMKSCLPVTPTDYGVIGIHAKKGANSSYLAQITGRKMSSSDVVPLMTPFAKAYNLVGNTFSKGDFWIPTPEEISVILDGTNTSTDPLNIGLTAIGGSTIINTAHLWSCLRYVSNYAWYARGNRGYFAYGRFPYRFAVVPVSRSII